MGRESSDKLTDSKISIKDRLKRWLGVGQHTPFVDQYFIRSNTKASLYAAGIVIFLEIWMLFSQVYYLLNDVSYSNEQFNQEMMLSVVLMITCVCLLIYTINRDENKSSVQLSHRIIWIFSVACILFGFSSSYFDYIKDGDAMVFLAMEIIVVCLLVWKPYISIIVTIASFALFYLLIASVQMPSVNFNVSYTIVFISILATSISNYHQKKKEADKDESLIGANKHLSDAAVKDELTDTANMSFFRKRAAEILTDPQTNYTSMIFLFLDIENFRPLNEKYGFEAGNSFLKKIASKIIDTFYDGLVARQGDDHFVVLCGKYKVKERLAEIRSYIYDMEFDTQTGLKAGGYPVRIRLTDPAVACDKARYACNSIKKHYDQDYCEYDVSLDKQFTMRQYIVNNVDAAIDRGDIKVYYQPVCWSHNRKLCGYEALTKWQDSTHGFIPTPLFIPVLEEYHQVHKIDMVVIETVCRDLRWLMDNNRPAVPVSLNFSRLDFELTDVVSLLVECTERYKIPHDMIHVEVTESALSDNLDSLHRDLDELKALGFPLWLDDFGSGYSSLNVLKDFSFDVMKVDMVFLSSFYDKPDKTKAVIKNIVSLANDLGMHTLTEGVETMDEAEYLKSIGCERLQGYLFGKPMPLKDALVKIQAGTLPVSEEYL